jgi:protocatechuate 3,4-dioxygenase beta subunit
MDKRLKMLTALTVITIMTVAIVYASYWIYSNVVHMTVTDYSLNLAVANDGLQVTFTATLKDPSGNLVSGKTIEFWSCSDPNNPQNLIYKFGEAVTNDDGVATYTTTVAAGTYNFVARASVP